MSVIREKTVRLVNESTGTTLADDGRVADGFLSRLVGLIGHQPLTEGEGLLIVPCSSVHTCFMGFPIDVLYLDANLKVVGADCDLVPWRIGRFYRGARYVLELPKGTVQSTQTTVGDHLSIQGYDL